MKVKWARGGGEIAFGLFFGLLCFLDFFSDFLLPLSNLTAKWIF